MRKRRNEQVEQIIEFTIDESVMVVSNVMTGKERGQILIDQ